MTLREKDLLSLDSLVLDLKNTRNWHSQTCKEFDLLIYLEHVPRKSCLRQCFNQSLSGLEDAQVMPESKSAPQLRLNY